MTYDAQLREAAEHLGFVISKEKANGEYLLASVVQDSLLYHFHSYAQSPFLLNIAYHAAQIAIRATRDHLYLNEFSISESIRGTMHSMVSLGGDPALMAIAITSGGLHELNALLPPLSPYGCAYETAITKGICSAARDMGLNVDKIRYLSQILHSKKIENMNKGMEQSSELTTPNEISPDGVA